MNPPTFTDVQTAPCFVDALERFGHRTALIAGDDVVTYDELAQRTRELAGRLGTTRRLVAVEAAPTVESISTYLAALRGRHPVLLLSPDDEASSRLIEAYGPNVVATASSRWALDERHGSSAHELHPDLALLLSTSGSTGSAKLVRLSLDGVHANAAAIASYLQLSDRDRAITTLPLHYCYGLSVLNSHLAAGASVVLNELSVVDPCFWRRIESTGATSFAGVPYTFDLLESVDLEHRSPPSLRYLTQAGGRMRPEQVRRYAAIGARCGWDLFVMYGQTEATARMAYLPPALAATRPAAIGVAVPGGELSIEPIDGDPERGELVYRGPNVMLGYAETPDDLGRGRDVHVLRTGDLGRRADDGLFEITGRRSRIVKPFGIRIELDHLERLLERDGIRAVCTGTDDRLVVAVVDRTDPHAVSDLAALHVGIPRRHITVLELDELPHLPNGKPDHAALLATADDRSADDPDDRAPRCAGQATTVDDVRAAYERVLGRPVSTGDSFVSAGGDSLSYVELSVRLEYLLGHLPDGWHLRPLHELRPTARRRWVRYVEPTVVLRALAILMVVSSHTRMLRLLGGAHLMMAIAGYNFGRFQRTASGALRGARRIAVPAVCWLTLAVLIGDRYNWVNAGLLTSVLNRRGDLWAYWFIEALVQILLVVGALLSIPAVRRLERRAPFATAIAVTVATLTIRFDVIRVGPQDHPIERAHQVAWLFALGWAAATAGRSVGRRLLVSALLLAAMPGFFGMPWREAFIVAGLLAVLWVRRIPLIHPLPRAAAVIGSASLWIYLSHWQVYPTLRSLHSPALGFVVAIPVGVALWQAERVLVRWFAARRARAGRRPTAPARAAVI